MVDKNYDTNVDTLAKFGASFQTKAVTALVSSPEFLQQSLDIVNPNFFELDAHRWIVETTMDYFNEYRALPTLDVFKVELGRSVKDDALRVSVVEELREVHKRITDTDLAYVRNEFLEFAKNQALKSAIIKSVDLLQLGRYPDIKNIVDKAMRSGQPNTVGHDWKRDIDERMNNSARNTVTTGWDAIDLITDGGLAAGELGVVMAPSGIGKSWFLATIGANAMRAGKKVAHYTLELNDKYVGIRYDTIYTGIEPKKITEHADLVRDAVEKIPGELIVKYYPARSITANTIHAHIQQMVARGHKPDIIIIDYADLMESVGKSDAKHEKLGLIYEELRGLAGEMGVPIWTASQTQRAGLQDEVIQADRVAESYAKIMTADLIVSVSRKLEDRAQCTGRAHVIKNRFGQDGITFPMYIDTSTGRVEVFDENSPKGIMLKRQMQNAPQLMKQTLAKKLEQYGMQ